MDGQSSFPARDRLLRCVGRNLANFQLLERMLKELIPLMRFDAEVEALSEVMARRRHGLRKATLGTLLAEYRAVYVPNDMEASQQQAYSAEKFRIIFSVSGTSDIVQQERRELRALLRERNHLVHTQLVSSDLNDIAVCECLADTLDAQNERLGIALDRLSACGREILQAFEVAVEHYADTYCAGADTVADT